MCHIFLVFLKMHVMVLGIICFLLVLAGAVSGTVSKRDDYNYYDNQYENGDEDEYGPGDNIQSSDSEEVPKILSKPETFELSLDSVVELPCQASSTDVVRGWNKDKFPLFQGSINLVNKKNLRLFSNGSLEVTIQSDDDYGKYSCILMVPASNRSEIEHEIIKLASPTIEALYANNNNTTVLRPGELLTINCQATGYPKPNISWYKDNMLLTTEEIEGEYFEGEILLIEFVQEKHAGRYRCLADNSVGKPDHKDIDIHVNHYYNEDGSGDEDEYIPGYYTQDSDNEEEEEFKFLSKPKTFKQSLDSVVVLPCRTSPPDVVKIWTHDGVPLFQDNITLNNRNNQMIVSDGSLKVTLLGEEDFGKYFCIIPLETDQFGSWMKIEHEIIKLSSPTIKVLYANITALHPGEAITLTCQATGYPKPNISWYKNNMLLTTEEVEGEKFIIQSVQPKHAGRYTCLADNSVGKPDQKDIDIHVIQNDYDEDGSGDEDEYGPGQNTQDSDSEEEKGFQFLSEPETFIQTLDSVVVLPCRTYPSGVERLWEKDGALLFYDKIGLGNIGSNQMIQSDSSLKVTLLGEEDFGNYSCVIPFKTRPLYLWPQIAHEIRKPISSTIEALYANDNNITVLNPGEVLTLTCQATGYPKPRIAWYKDNMLLTTQEEVLLIESVQSKHAGRYRCVAYNNVGKSDKKEIDIYLNHKNCYSSESKVPARCTSSAIRSHSSIFVVLLTLFGTYFHVRQLSN